jgi:hypothetical protein
MDMGIDQTRNEESPLAVDQLATKCLRLIAGVFDAGYATALNADVTFSLDGAPADIHYANVLEDSATLNRAALSRERGGKDDQSGQDNGLWHSHTTIPPVAGFLPHPLGGQPALYTAPTARSGR